MKILLIITGLLFYFLANQGYAQTRITEDSLHKWAQQEDAKKEAQSIEQLNNRIKGISNSRGFSDEEMKPGKYIVIAIILLAVLKVAGVFDLFLDKLEEKFWPSKEEKLRTERIEAIQLLNDNIKKFSSEEIAKMTYEEISEKASGADDLYITLHALDYLIEKNLVCKNLNIPKLRKDLLKIPTKKIHNMTIDEIAEKFRGDDQDDCDFSYVVEQILQKIDIKYKEDPDI